MNSPSRVLLAPRNRLFVADSGNHRILEIELDRTGLSGRIAGIFGGPDAGLVDGSREVARFNTPRGMSYWRGTIYLADAGNDVVRAIDLSRGETRTVAGTGERGSGRVVAGGQALFTPIRTPTAVWADSDAALIIALAGSHQIALCMDEGVIGPFAGMGERAVIDGPRSAAAFFQPWDLAVGFDHLFVIDRQAHMIRAISLADEPVVSSLAGQPAPGDSDGTGEDVRLNQPAGIAFHDGVLFVADGENHRIKRLDPMTARCETLIGNGRQGLTNGSFEDAELNMPEGLSIESGLLYIADRGNHAVRVANLASRTIHTLELSA